MACVKVGGTTCRQNHQAVCQVVCAGKVGRGMGGEGMVLNGIQNGRQWTMV